MSEILDNLINPLLAWLEWLASAISLEVFVVIGSFLEELVAPIPSPFVMTTVAVLAQVQNYSTMQLGILVVLASIAKTFSSYVLYVVSDKAEDIIIGRFGKYFGVSHQQIEGLGKFLTNSWVDDVLLLLARALPFVPTSLVTVAAGLIKYEVRSFIVMTFLGTVIRNLFYLWIAYFGWSHFHAIQEQLIDNPLILVLLVVVAGVGVVMLLKAKDKLWDHLLSKKAA